MYGLLLHALWMPSLMPVCAAVLSMGGVQLLAHPAMEEAISDQDQDVFMHLTRLHVAEHLDGSEQDYRITFVRPPCNHVQLYRSCFQERASY
jgi:TorA maturation chaperone TorD